jgi:phosphohistidine phosphatase
LTPVDLPEVVLCSTATRTRQTAERALAKLAEPPPVDYLASLYDASIEAVLDEVRRLEDGVGSVMVVGHNPTAHALAFEMMAASDKAGRRQVERVGFPTCSLAVYRLNIRRWSDLGLGSATLIGLFVPPY